MTLSGNQYPVLAEEGAGVGAADQVRAHPQISGLSRVKLPPAGEMPGWFG
jgi:hypothetical protein